MRKNKRKEPTAIDLPERFSLVLNRDVSPGEYSWTLYYNEQSVPPYKIPWQADGTLNYPRMRGVSLDEALREAEMVANEHLRRVEWNRKSPYVSIEGTATASDIAQKFEES